MVTLDEILHNCRVKTFASGRVELIASPVSCFRETGWESAAWGELKGKEAQGATSEAENLIRARRRARSAVHDLCHANGFDRFVTFTLDAQRVDRYDVEEVTKKLNVWLDNRVRRNGLKYVLVPELHKDGAIHFHGLINSEALEATDSGTLTRGGKPRRPRGAAQRAAMLADGWQIVYNLPQWTLGFSTGIDLYGDYDAAVGYVCKYIAKTERKVGGRWYYSGGALERPNVVFTDIEWDVMMSDYPDGVWTTKDGAQFCSVTMKQEG